MKNVKIKPKYALIFLLCLIMMVFELIPILKEMPITSDPLYNRLISLILPLISGFAAIILIAKEFGLKLFKKPEKSWVLMIGFIIALDNFPWLAYSAGKMRLNAVNPLHFGLFGVYCILVGLFEEVLFRGVFFALLAGIFERTRKGFLYTYVLSSVAFGAVHILNIFTSGPAAILQAGYSILTGGLFAFVFIKTKNILFPALIHAVYNFCGLLFTEYPGLGTGSIIDTPTAIMMAIISILVGVYVLYSVRKYPETERTELYNRLNLLDTAKEE